MLYLCWKILLPFSLACLIGSALWDLFIGSFYDSRDYALFFFPK
jgi:hypothetical protein